MTTLAEQLRSQLAVLSPLDRAELARFLIDSLDQGEDSDREIEWKMELANRAEEIVSGRESATPAETVFDELRTKHS